MGKQGPCYHCGTLSTPLWRNGPPDKPVLCNACGSRYRIRGSLANYAPKHAQGQPVAKRARISSSKTASKKAYFRIEDNFSTDSCHSSNSSDYFTSSSESAMSYPPCCYKIKEEDEGVIIKRSSPWESCIPSRKRSSVVHRSLTPIERLQKDLRNILKYEDPSNWAENGEDLLIYNTNNLQIPYNEIGLGSLHLKPNSTSVELAHMKPQPFLLDIKISSFNESQNRSSTLDELKKQLNQL